MQHSISNARSTQIDNSFIEEYFTYAPAEYVKVYIIALSKVPRNTNRLNIMEIARTLNSSLLEISKALEYWREKKVIDIVEDTDLGQLPVEHLEKARNYEKIKLIFKNIQLDALPSLPVMPDMTSTEAGTASTNSQTPESDIRDSFQEFIAKLEYVRRGKTLSHEAIRRLAYYKNNLGLSIELLELACNLSYDNPNVKESNHLNYARGILNNFYEANIFTLEDYYRRERQKDYRVPSPEEVARSGQTFPLRHSAHISGENQKHEGIQRAKYEKTKSEMIKQEHTQIDKIQQNIDAQRMNMRKKLNKNMNNR